MSQQITFINSFDFARDGSIATGTIEASSLTRLADSLFDQQGLVKYLIKGEFEKGSGSSLVLHIEGALHLRCQRCLNALDYTVQVDRRLRLVRPGGQWPDDLLEDDTFDAIEGGDELVLLSLIEDELLLVLPVAPKHQACSLPDGFKVESNVLPFAALAQLKKRD